MMVLIQERGKIYIYTESSNRIGGAHAPRPYVSYLAAWMNIFVTRYEICESQVSEICDRNYILESRGGDKADTHFDYWGNSI